MRVIAGSARRKNLICPKGDHTRPTTDRIKETLFNMIQSEIPDARFLDLFGGSGGIGIEALSRGAEFCVFAENDRNALNCIKENLRNTGFSEKSQVMAMDYMQALRRLADIAKPFDVVFLDPPYGKGFEEKAVEYMVNSKIVDTGSLILVETSLDTDTDYTELSGLQVEKIKEYKTNRHIFLRVL